jgi:Collagen triple helix repeat (20 copies)
MPPEDWLIRKPKLRAPPHQKSYLEEKIMSLTCARRLIRNAFRCLLWLALLSLPLLAQAPPSADTFVSSSTPKINYGSTIALAVGPGTTTYVRFNLAGIPAGASISKATLRLYVDAVGKPGNFDVYQLNSGWAENTLTYNTPPPPLGLSVTNGTGVSITTANWNQFLLIDITALAQGWVNGTIPNNGVALALTSGSSGSFSFDSKESLLTGNGPELEIAFNSGTGPQGAQGPAGPVGPQGPKGVAGAVGPTGPTGATGAQGATGLQGAQGPLGPMGLTGAQGLQGVAGPQGAAGTGFNFRAAFDGSATYAPYDVVSYNGSSYNAKATINPGDPAPDVNPNWSLMAQQGAAGAQGPTGVTGATGATGATGPQGPQGPAGAQGSPGAGGGINGITEILTSTDFTVPAGVSHLLIEAWGGGGGGGGGTAGTTTTSCDIFGLCTTTNTLGAAGGGGGGGGYVRAVIAVSGGATYHITIGSGGPGGNGEVGTTAATDGTDGSATQILDASSNIVLNVPGGEKGTAASGIYPGQGGLGGSPLSGNNIVARRGGGGGNGSGSCDISGGAGGGVSPGSIGSAEGSGGPGGFANCGAGNGGFAQTGAPGEVLIVY